MLAADKLQLQSALKQQATALKEKEFQLHHSNLMTVGTQAAVLAGLDITMFIEFHPEPLSSWSSQYMVVGHILFITYYTMIVMAFCSNIIVVSQTTVLSVLGAGLALRGPDSSSMIIATDALYEERKFVFTIFAVGLTCTLGSVLNGVWLMLPFYAALLCCIVASFTCYIIYTNYQRISNKLDYDESQTVDFYEFMSIIPSVNNHNKTKKSPSNHRKTSSSSSTNHKKSSPNHTNSNMSQRKRRSRLNPSFQQQQQQQLDYEDCYYDDDDHNDIESQQQTRTLLSSSNPRQRHQQQNQPYNSTEEYSDDSYGDDDHMEFTNNQYNNHSNNNNNRQRKNHQQRSSSKNPKSFSIQTV